MRSYFLLLFTFLTLMVSGNIQAYSDITFSWYRESIDAFTSEGIIQGYSSTQFAPHAHITRAELAKVAMRSANIPTEDVMTDCFRDAINDRSLMQWVCSAFKRGIVRGKNGLFRPIETISVGEVLMIGMRANGILVESSGSSLPPSEYMTIADARGIISRDSYLFDQKATRGVAVELLWRMRESVKNGAGKLANISRGCSDPRWSLGNTNTIEVNGKSRSYLLSTPSDMTKGKAIPLIVTFHGRTNSNIQVKSYMKLEWGQSWDSARNRWTSLGQTQAIIAYPAGLSVRGGYSWAEAENIEFFDAMITEISRAYCIDREQLYIVGHSLGGYMANKVSCVRGDIVAGVAAVAGPGYSSTCAGPVKTLVMHHPNDKLVAYSQWQTAYRQHVEANRCQESVQTTALGAFSCQTSCRDDMEVVWCGGTYETAGWDPHSWPTGGGAVILDYFDIPR